MKKVLVKEHSGGFKLGKDGKPVFHFVECAKFGESMEMEMPANLAPWYRKKAEELDMSFTDCWMMLMAKAFVMTADEPLTMKMVVSDIENHAEDPTCPVDFSSQLKKSLNKSPRILAEMRREVANFDAYIKALTEWLEKETARLKIIKETAEFIAM